MNHTRLTVRAIRVTIASTTTEAVTLPLGTEYFTIAEEGGAGDIRWAATSSADAAGDLASHRVSAGATSPVIGADPTTLWLNAPAGEAKAYIFIVCAGT